MVQQLSVGAAGRGVAPAGQWFSAEAAALRLAGEVPEAHMVDTGLWGCCLAAGVDTETLGSGETSKHPWRHRVGDGWGGAHGAFRPLQSQDPQAGLGCEVPKPCGGSPGVLQAQGPQEKSGRILSCPQPTARGHQLRRQPQTLRGEAFGGSPEVPVVPIAPSWGLLCLPDFPVPLRALRPHLDRQPLWVLGMQVVAQAWGGDPGEGSSVEDGGRCTGRDLRSLPLLPPWEAGWESQQGFKARAKPGRRRRVEGWVLGVCLEPHGDAHPAPTSSRAAACWGVPKPQARGRQ